MRTISNLRDICSVELGGDAEVDVIDVLDRPDLAERDRILATPTLIKNQPAPSSRISGDLSDRLSALQGLDFIGSAPINADSFRFGGTE